MRVRMHPDLSEFENGMESGIKRVVEAYHTYGPQHGIQFVGRDDECDLVAIHAGMYTRYDREKPLVSHCHGLYWTHDYAAAAWEWRANANVVWSLRNATLITVPSDWVAETIQRDMRIDPHVVHHGIEADAWAHSYPVEGHVLWNKNRNMDVCNPEIVGRLASVSPDYQFVSTFLPSGTHTNIQELGIIDHERMKKLVQTAGVYLSTTKETFGIGVLEALAAGTPVLGFDYGGNKIMVKHGVNGYLAKPGDVDDLKRGLEYCREYRSVLSANAKSSVSEFTWPKAVGVVAQVYRMAITMFEKRDRPMHIDEALYQK